MKFSILIAALVLGVCLVQFSEARGFGGRGFGGFGGRGFGGFGGRGFGGFGRGIGYGIGGRYGWGMGGLGLGGWGLGRFGYGGWGYGYNPYSWYTPWSTGLYRYYRDTMSHGNINERIECGFIGDRSVLSCQGPTRGVECEVVGNFTALGTKHSFELFGIGNACNGKKNFTTELMHYNMFPRLVDNSAWMNHTFLAEANHPVNIQLFHSISITDKYFGYRVVNFQCWEQFVELFNSVPHNSYENVTVVNENGVNRNVSLFGEIITEKPTKL